MDFFTENYDPCGFPADDPDAMYAARFTAHTNYILDKIAKNYSNVKLSSILQKSVDGEEERTWNLILANFLGGNLMSNYPNIHRIHKKAINNYEAIGCRNSSKLINYLLGENNIVEKRPLLDSLPSPYVKMVLSKFLFRVVKYVLRGFRITNLGILADGFPESIVTKLFQRKEFLVQPQIHYNAADNGWGDGNEIFY